MKSLKTCKVWLLVFCVPFFLSGCIAALAVPVVAGLGAATYGFINLARDQYPDIDFNKPAPVEVAYANSYEDVWNGTVDTLMQMKESMATVDKNSGIIRTNKKNLNDVSWIGKGLGKATFLYELNITVRKKNGRISVEMMVPFWEEKAFVAQKEKNIPEGSNMMRHIFYRNMENRVPSVAVRLPDSPMQDMRYSPLTAEAQPKDNMSNKAAIKNAGRQETAGKRPIEDVKSILLKVKPKVVNIRSAPSTKGAPIATLKGGTEVEKIDEKGLWFKILFIDKAGNPQEGWVARSLVE